VRAQHAGQSIERYEHCLDVLLGKRRIYVHEPTFLHFPHLPAIEFYAREFAWLDALEAATDDIRSELLAVLADEHAGLVPYVDNPEGVPSLEQWRELNNSLKWSAYYLFRDGVRVTEHCARCPKTAQALQGMPLLDVPGRAPTAFFSLLKPHTHIPPHTGVSNTRLVVHLPLIIPEGCALRVGSETRAWKPGRAWVFDDTIEHEAWNKSDQLRGVLIFDIWNPHLSTAERDLVRATIHGVETFYARAEEQARADDQSAGWQ
jgi:aspartyl/asparaginyl beta-hydroxylase (cupin superfamily)